MEMEMKTKTKTVPFYSTYQTKEALRGSYLPCMLQVFVPWELTICPTYNGGGQLFWMCYQNKTLNYVYTCLWYSFFILALGCIIWLLCMIAYKVNSKKAPKNKQISIKYNNDFMWENDLLSVISSVLFRWD